jgi:hypothetical protein
MRYAIVKNQLAINIIEWDGVSPLTVDGDLIQAADGVGIGWTYDGSWSPPPPKPPTVPKQITMRQGRLALLQDGLLDQVESVIYAMPEPNRSSAQVEWEYSAVLVRDYPLVVELGAGLGLTPDEIDALFIKAKDL